MTLIDKYIFSIIANGFAKVNAQFFNAVPCIPSGPEALLRFISLEEHQAREISNKRINQTNQLIISTPTKDMILNWTTFQRFKTFTELLSSISFPKI